MKNRKQLLLVAFATLVFLVSTIGAEVLAAQAVENGYYKITARHSGKALDVQYALTSNGSAVVQYTPNGKDNQIWLMQYDPEDGTYLIIAKHSEKCLEIPGGSTTNGKDACQWDWNDQNHQKWNIYNLGNGYHKLINKKSGKCLEVTGGFTTNATAVQQWDYTGKNHQQWKLTKLPIYYPGASGTGPYATRYPILLLHGVALRDSTLGYNYFGRIPNHLRSYGAKVEGGGQDAWGDMNSNADQILAKINSVRSAYGAAKVHIIAHSKGGLDTRAMLLKYKKANQDLRPYIASFTTIATPHRGSKLADLLYDNLPVNTVTALLDAFGLIQGDDYPDAKAAAQFLKSSNLAGFNAECQQYGLGTLASGIPGIFCQSYGAKIKGIVLDPVLQLSGLAQATLGGESPNDGAVWVNSYPYANNQGVQSGASWCGGVTHFGIVDRGILIFPGFTPGFDARSFYLEIVSDLKNLENSMK